MIGSSMSNRTTSPFRRSALCQHCQYKFDNPTGKDVDYAAHRTRSEPVCGDEGSERRQRRMDASGIEVWTQRNPCNPMLHQVGFQNHKKRGPRSTSPDRSMTPGLPNAQRAVSGVSCTPKLIRVPGESSAVRACADVSTRRMARRRR